MLTGKIRTVIDHIRNGCLLQDAVVPTDGELLARFINHHDEAALAILVRRHGPMVWGVCRRLLSHHNAEDAFQATFLVLVRKAESVAPRELVGNWLYGVAHQTALQARRTAARRQAREVQVMQMPEAKAAGPDEWLDLLPILDEELSQLPDKYRAVIVLCDLQCRTRKEVARHLGVPDGTVAGRLARARAMLAKRLTRRGATLSCGSLAVVFAQHMASACMPNAVMSSTIQAAALVAAGQSAATGTISAKVAALTDGVLKAMLISKLKSTVAVVVALSVLAIGATALTQSPAVTRGHQLPAAEKTVNVPTKQNEAKAREATAQPAQHDGGWDLRAPTKEPKYRKDARYALLVFGLKREQRVWMVLDDTTLYVDRNGNGDLTDPGERLKPDNPKDGSNRFGGSGSHTHFDIFEFTVQVGATGTAKFQLHHWIRAENFTPKTDFDKQWHADWLKLRWENSTLWRKEGQGQGQTPLLFMPKPADAQVCALDGPLTFLVRLPEHQVLKRGAAANDVAFCIAVKGRPPRGVERSLHNPLATTEVPENAHLEVEVEYPTQAANAEPLRRKYLLKQRC